MIGAGGITAHAQCAYQLLARRVKRQTAAKHVDAADLLSHKRIIGLSVVGHIAGIGDVVVNRIAKLQTEEATAILRGGIKVGRG